MLQIDARPGAFGMVFAENPSAQCLAPLTVHTSGSAQSMVAGASFIAPGERKLVARVDAPGATVVLMPWRQPDSVLFGRGPVCRGQKHRSVVGRTE